MEHPVVRTHPATGRKALVRQQQLHDADRAGSPTPESAALLRLLFEHVGSPEFQVRFRWEPGSVAVWDNRCTQHYAVPDYTGHRRVMHRVAITGERPV